MQFLRGICDTKRAVDVSNGGVVGADLLCYDSKLKCPNTKGVAKFFMCSVSVRMHRRSAPNVVFFQAMISNKCRIIIITPNDYRQR